MVSARKQRDDQHGVQAAVTIPAPQKGSSESSHVDTSTRDEIPSSRPTSVPGYDVTALAAASAPSVTKPRLPFDLAVPVRRRASPDGVPLRAAFLLSHVDDRATIAEIAGWAQIPLAEAIDAFHLLATLGLVELRNLPDPTPGPRSEQKPPMPVTQSGLRPKTG